MAHCAAAAYLLFYNIAPTRLFELRLIHFHFDSCSLGNYELQLCYEILMKLSLLQELNVKNYNN